jgi:hypothetical protein
VPSPAPMPPAGPSWIHEIEHDGFRLMARRDPAGIRLMTRRGNEALVSDGPLVNAGNSALKWASGRTPPRRPAGFGLSVWEGSSLPSA